MEILQDFDERLFQPGDLETVLDAADEANGVDLRTDVLQQTTDKRCVIDQTDGARNM